MTGQDKKRIATCRAAVDAQSLARTSGMYSMLYYDADYDAVKYCTLPYYDAHPQYIPERAAVCLVGPDGPEEYYDTPGRDRALAIL